MFSANATDLINSRYRYKPESVDGVFLRVAKALSIKDEKFEKELYHLMIDGIFLPNSPAIRNAGKKKATLSACFVLPIDDNMGSIFDTIRNTALVFQRGGGVGINFSALRPKDSPLSSGGYSSGAVSFMRLFDTITEVVRQGGFRRGASLFSLGFSHPEIFNFCRAKLTGNLTNANLSVVVTDKFMKKATNSGQVELKFGDQVYTRVRAADILDLVSLGTWIRGDPGLLFYDRINQDNKNKDVPIMTTNPCGEVPLFPYGACCLGSINISKFIEGNNFNFDKFYDVVKLGSRALTHINILNSYPLPQIQKAMSDSQPQGIGIMGFADALIMLGIKYDSEPCLEFIKQLGKYYVQASDEAAPEAFYKRSIAPTGSLSILADCSHGIEPIFAKQYERRVVAGTFIEGKEIYASEYCRMAHDISPDWHLKVQAAFQEITDAGVSKTINIRNNTSVDEIKKIYIKAWKMRVKGVTIFRDGSIEGVLKPINKCDDGSCAL